MLLYDESLSLDLSSPHRPGRLRAETLAARLGIPIVRHARLTRCLGKLRHTLVPGTWRVNSRKILIPSSLDTDSEEGQWILWHELGHAVDVTPFIGDAFYQWREWPTAGRHSAMFKLLTPREVTAIAGLQKFTLYPSLKPPGDTPRQQQEADHSFAEFVKKWYGYKESRPELFAEAFACFAMYPGVLRERSPVAFGLVGAAFLNELPEILNEAFSFPVTRRLVSSHRSMVRGR